MTVIEDTELLRRYAEDRSQDAFAELARRHLDLVYSVALRQVGGDTHLAEDVAQRVFADLARKAAGLSRRAVLGGWLYRSTHFAASDAVRAERRRRAREQEAQTRHDLSTNGGDGTQIDWEKLRSVIDQTMSELNDADRDAVWLRFFEGRSLADVGARLRLTENAARMRVERALDKLHALLERRGVTSTSAALAVALGSGSLVAAPSGLAVIVTTSALAGGGAASGGAMLAFMSMTKLQVGLAGALVVAGAAGFTWQEQRQAALREELAELRRQNQSLAALQTENVTLSRRADQAEVARAQTAELTQLRNEATAIRSQLQSAAVRSAPAAKAQKTPTPFTGQFFEATQVGRKPNPTSQVAPLIPPEVRKLGVSQQALVDFIVDADGKVRNATVLNATHPAFGQSAVEAVERWQFEPGQKEGVAVATHMSQPVVLTFAAEEKSGANPSGIPSGTKPQRAPVQWF